MSSMSGAGVATAAVSRGVCEVANWFIGIPMRPATFCSLHKVQDFCS
jgi:hypothetical protein